MSTGRTIIVTTLICAQAAVIGYLLLESPVRVEEKTLPAPPPVTKTVTREVPISPDNPREFNGPVKIIRDWTIPEDNDHEDGDKRYGYGVKVIEIAGVQCILYDRWPDDSYQLPDDRGGPAMSCLPPETRTQTSTR